MRRHAGGAGTAAPADVPRKRISGRPRVTVRPNYVGLPPVGLDAGRTNAGESLRDQVGQRAPVRPRKLRSRSPKSPIAVTLLRRLRKLVCAERREASASAQGARAARRN